MQILFSVAGLLIKVWSLYFFIHQIGGNFGIECHFHAKFSTVITASFAQLRTIFLSNGTSYEPLYICEKDRTSIAEENW